MRNKAPWRIAIVVSRFNSRITHGLLDRCEEELVLSGVRKKNIKVVWTPGSFELPLTAYQFARSRRFDAVVALGCILKGETAHDKHIASWASIGLGLAGLMTSIPVIFGVLTPNTEKQALARSKRGPLNRGQEAAKAALEMIRIAKEVQRTNYGIKTKGSRIRAPGALSR